MQTAHGADLTVQVTLMTNPCLWRWEIRDVARGEVLDNSWAADWMAYESFEEAYRAGRARLRALSGD